MKFSELITWPEVQRTGTWLSACCAETAGVTVSFSETEVTTGCGGEWGERWHQEASPATAGAGVRSQALLRGGPVQAGLAPGRSLGILTSLTAQHKEATAAGQRGLSRKFPRTAPGPGELEARPGKVTWSRGVGAGSPKAALISPGQVSWRLPAPSADGTQGNCAQASVGATWERLVAHLNAPLWTASLGDLQVPPLLGDPLAADTGQTDASSVWQGSPSSGLRGQAGAGTQLPINYDQGSAGPHPAWGSSPQG